MRPCSAPNRSRLRPLRAHLRLAARTGKAAAGWLPAAVLNAIVLGLIMELRRSARRGAGAARRQCTRIGFNA